MDKKYNVSGIKVVKVKELPDSWSKSDYIKLLQELDVDDVDSLNENDMHDMLVMALQDKELVPAAEILLGYRLEKVLDDGDRQHTAEEYLHAELWNEHADIKLHKELFNVGILLHDAFPNLMTEPVCARTSFKITAYDKEAENDFKKGGLASLLVRVIADGMDISAKLNRLFEDQIKEGPFPEAKSILWKINLKEAEANENIFSREVELYLSYEWVKDFGNIDSYDSKAFSDK